MGKQVLEFLKKSKDVRVSAIASLALEANISYIEAVEHYNESKVVKVNQ